MTKPTIHLNGSSVDDLLQDYRDAMNAVAEAIDKTHRTSPNARDYYVQGDDAYRDARNEHKDRIAKLVTVYDELEELALHCCEIQCEQEARRKEREKMYAKD